MELNSSERFLKIIVLWVDMIYVTNGVSNQEVNFLSQPIKNDGSKSIASDHTLSRKVGTNSTCFFITNI